MSLSSDVNFQQTKAVNKEKNEPVLREVLHNVYGMRKFQTSRPKL